LSRIWDAIKWAEQQKGSRAAPTGNGGQEKQESDRRRSARLALCVPVFVYGHAHGEEPFHEETKTLRVNAHGGLLTLAASVKRGQKLLLTNKVTQKEQECHVVYLGPKHPKKIDVGIEFTRPTPDFWHTKP